MRNNFFTIEIQIMFFYHIKRKKLPSVAIILGEGVTERFRFHQILLVEQYYTDVDANKIWLMASTSLQELFYLTQTLLDPNLT